jgi:alpha-tubulin suppressor-like RCC1 family protein
VRSSRWTFAVGLIGAAMALGCGPRESGSSPGSGSGAPPPQGKNNLALEVSAPGLERVAVEVRSQQWATLKSEIKAVEGRALGGIFLPPNGDRELRLTGFDAKGAEIYRGSDRRAVGETIAAMSVLMQPVAAGDPIVADLATERLEISRTDAGEAITLRARVFDPDGQPLKFDPLDIKWSLNDARDWKLKPVPDGGIMVVPPPDLVKLCPFPGKVYACKIGQCEFVDVCRDPFVTIAAGSMHTCAVTQNGFLYCWGLNSDGQLGTPTTETCGSSPCSKKPISVRCPPGAPCTFKYVFAGSFRTCAVDTNYDAWCWGGGTPTHARFVGQSASGPTKIQGVGVGFNHVCGVTLTNDLWCAGDNHLGQQGRPRGPDVPLGNAVRVLAPLKFRRVVAGVHHTCAIAADSTGMVCFGDHRGGQLLPRNAPTPVQSESGCTCTSQPVFQPLGGGVTVVTAAAGPENTCMRKSTGETACWGVGLGFVTVPNTQQFDRITAGEQHMCGLAGQTAFCGGLNNWGQIGVSPLGTQFTPVAVTTPPAAYTDIAAGGSHTCGITTAGDAFCWGNNFSGQLGNGTSGVLPTMRPVQVVR